MQLGHVPLALSIASFDWSPKTVLFCLAMHFLPNADTLVSKAGLAKPSFHCTVTHTLAFAIVVTAIVYMFSPFYAAFAFVALVTHYLADLGSTVGLPLLWPLSRKKFTIALFKDTGSWGWEMYKGYYRQPQTWALEGAVVVFFVWRMTQVYA